MKWYQTLIKRVLSGVFLFLLPVTLLAFILGKAFIFFRKLILPLKDHLPDEHVMGIGLLTLISLILIVFVCYLAGLLSESKSVKSLIIQLEDNFLVLIPGYAMLRSRASDALSEEDNKWRSVLVKESDGWRLGIEVDRTPGEHATIYFPGPPDPRSGVIKLVLKSKIRTLNVPVSDVVKAIRKYGDGTSSWVNDEADQPKLPTT